MAILPMSEGLTQTHGQDARATAGSQMQLSIGKCARDRLFGETSIPLLRLAVMLFRFSRWPRFLRDGAIPIPPVRSATDSPFP